MALHVVMGEHTALAAAPDHAVETIEEHLRDRLTASGDQRHGARGDAAPLLGRSPQAAVGEPSRQGT